MITSHTYSAEVPGPRLLIFGAVHGNEICGTEALRRAMAELDAGKLKLLRGQVEFVPIANPRAQAEGKRFIERNLNRYFLPGKEPATYEAKLTNILTRKIEACDCFIDLHSTTAGGCPFASIEGNDNEERALAEAMGAEYLVYGWHDAYAASGRVNPDPAESLGTTAYARRHGAKAVLLECGQHQDPQSIEVAYQAVRSAMRHLGLVEDVEKAQPKKPIALRIARVIYKAEGGVFAEKWGNFSPVKAGQIVAQRADGESVTATTDSYIVLPNVNASPGAEWFYFGEM